MHSRCLLVIYAGLGGIVLEPVPGGVDLRLVLADLDQAFTLKTGKNGDDQGIKRPKVFHDVT